MAAFADVESTWVGRLGNLRNVVRQEVIARQLADHVPAGSSVLDVGCGQGTQAMRLARAGCRVTGLDPSPDLLRLLRRDASEASIEIETIEGTIEVLDEVLGDREFDVVCSHGLLMYLEDRDWPLKALASHLRIGGILSVTVRNGDGLAFRPGMRGDWIGAVSAFDTMTYVNELGATARADGTEDFCRQLRAAGLDVVAWYGVRVFTDTAHADTPPPDGDQLRELLDAEDQAGRRDPYRRLASQTHFIARRSDTRHTHG